MVHAGVGARCTAWRRGTEAEAATTMVCAMAPCSSSLRTTLAIERLLLADRDVDALNARGLLVDDGVDRHRGLAGLAVADDELALAAADRHHRVDRLVAGLHRLATRSCGRSRPAPRARSGRCGLALIGPLPSIGCAERIDHAAEQLRAHRHLEDAARGLDRRRPRECACSRPARPRRPSPARGSAPVRRCCRGTPASRRSARRRGRGCARCRR